MKIKLEKCEEKVNEIDLSHTQESLESQIKHWHKILKRGKSEGEIMCAKDSLIANQKKLLEIYDNNFMQQRNEMIKLKLKNFNDLKKGILIGTKNSWKHFKDFYNEKPRMTEEIYDYVKEDIFGRQRA